MKKQVKLQFFVFLSTLPLPSLSIAALAKVNSLQNEIQNQKLLTTLADLRSKIMSKDKTYTTIEEAYDYFKSQTGLEGEALSHAFNKEIENLIMNKSILINSRGVIGGSPSFQ